MPNFDVSNLLTAQTMVSDKYKAADMRMKPAPAFELLTRNDNFLIVAADTLKLRDDRPIEAHLLARTKRATTSARSYSHVGTIDDSQKVTLTWTTKKDVFAISLKLLDKSVFDFDTVLANKFHQACMNILEDKETEAIAYLRASRATVQPAGLKGGSFNTPFTAVDIIAPTSASFFQRVKSIMKQNFFSGNLDIIVDANLMIAAEYLQAQGSNNGQNLQYQFPNLRIVESVELSDSNYANGIALAMPGEAVAALNWIPKENRNGWGDYNEYTGGYGTFMFMGYQFAVHGYSQRADTSLTNGDAQDILMQFEVSLDTSYNKSPLTAITGRTDSVIVEFGQD